MDNKDQTKGKIEQTIGNATGNDDLRRQGKADEKAGDVKSALTSVNNKAKDLVDKTKDKLTHK
jgi:uncharacterized protein YjbJ (UPF0337 family)